MTESVTSDNDSGSGSGSGSDSKQHSAPRATSGALRGVPGLTLCLRCPSGCTSRPAQCRYRATPAVHRSGAAVPATRQAAGAPSAWSHLSPASPARPRRWGDAGTPAARAAADQKAGAPGRHATRTTSRLPERPAASRTRDPSRNETDGQAGRPPPQCAPDRRRSGKPRQRSESANSDRNQRHRQRQDGEGEGEGPG